MLASVVYWRVHEQEDILFIIQSSGDTWDRYRFLDVSPLCADRAALHWPRKKLPDPALSREIDELMTQRPPADDINSYDPLLHAFQNHLSAIVGFCDLLLREIPEGDPKRADILEMYKAGHAAIDLLPQLSTRMR